MVAAAKNAYYDKRLHFSNNKSENYFKYEMRELIYRKWKGKSSSKPYFVTEIFTTYLQKTTVM
jgi:hypothetical protein